MGTRTIRAAIAGIAVATNLLAACGGGGKSTGATAATTKAPVTTVAGSDGKLPQFASGFDRVCKTQVGFPGAKAYEPTPGVHPVELFEDYRGESLVTTSRTLPAGWAVKEDTNYQDNSEFAAVELVACTKRGKLAPTGKRCDFEDKGVKTTLELVNATYDVKVYTATTGKQVANSTLEATLTECPYIAAFQKGDTTFVATPSDDDFINALKSSVAF